jgi:hypothetical protein
MSETLRACWLTKRYRAPAGPVFSLWIKGGENVARARPRDESGLRRGSPALTRPPP